MPADTDTPVQDTPATDDPPIVQDKTSKGSRFPKPKPISEVIREQAAKAEKPEPAKKEPEAKSEPEKPAKAAVEPPADATEPTKPSGDTKGAPEPKQGSLRATLSQGEPEPEKAKETKQDAAEEEEVADDDPTITAKFRRKVNRLRGETAKERTAREAAEKKAQELESRIAELEAKPKLSVEQQREWAAKDDELLKLRRRFDLESDPEVKRFDTKIEAAKKAVDSTIAKAAGIPEFVRTFIKDAGGFDAFMSASKLYDVKVGEDNKRLTGAQIYRHIQPDMDVRDIGTIQTSIGEQARLAAEKAAFVAEETGKAREYFEKQAQSQAEQARQAEAVQTQQAQMFKSVGERITKEKWMVDEDVPSTGDEETIKAAKSRNALRSQLRRIVDETINFKPTSSDPSKAAKEIQDFYFEVIRDSAKVYFVEHELKQSQARIKKLESELDAIKGASRTTPRGSNGAATPAGSGGTKVPARNEGEGDTAYSVRLQQAGVSEADRQTALMRRR